MLTSFFRKPNASPDAIHEMEDELDHLITMDLAAPPLDPTEHQTDPASEPFEFPALRGPASETVAQDEDHRLTSYSQTRLAGLAAFQELQSGVAEDLAAVSSALARISAASSRTRDFIGTTHSSIHRANEMELSNATLVSENRKLQQQVEQVKRLRSQYETLIETFRRKESRFEEEADTLRMELEAARQELEQVHAEIAALETERANLLGELSSKSSQAERYGRENELLREKHVSLNHDLENADRRSRESERKADELNAVNATLSSQLADLRTRLSSSEKEVAQLQRLLDTANADLAEAQDAFAALEGDHQENRKRHSGEIQKLKGEMELLKARADVATKAQIQASDEIGELKQKLSLDEAEKRQLSERLAMAKAELDAERAQHASITGKASEVGLQSESSNMMLEARNQEIEKLKREIKAQQEEIRRLSLIERIHNEYKKIGNSSPPKAAE